MGFIYYIYYYWYLITKEMDVKNYYVMWNDINFLYPNIIGYQMMTAKGNVHFIQSQNNYTKLNFTYMYLCTGKWTCI